MEVVYFRETAHAPQIYRCLCFLAILFRALVSFFILASTILYRPFTPLGLFLTVSIPVRKQVLRPKAHTLT